MEKEQYQVVIGACDENAKRIAIAFANWINQKENCKPSGFGNYWQVGKKYSKSTESLFNQFLKNFLK